MWSPILLIFYLLIYATGQDYHHPEDHNLYDYSISIDSNALYGLRRPDGPDNEDIVCHKGAEVHIDGVWFGYQDYQKIPMCHQDKLSQDCLFNLTSSPLSCHNGSCKFPQLSSNDDIPPNCRSGLRYWHVCYSCLSTQPALAHASEDQPVLEYDEYYYYDYDYETPHTTYRFDVEGNEDLTCESQHHHLVVESVKYGFDKEVIKNHKYEDGDSDCVFDFTNEFVHMMCTRIQCKSPMLKDLKKYNVGKNCKEKALLGMWEIIYICQENHDSQYDDLQDIVESHDIIDEEPVESEDNLEQKDYINPVVSEVDEILDPVGIEGEIKFEPEVENVEKFEEESKLKIKPLEIERKNVPNLGKAKNEVNPDVIKVEIEEDRNKIAVKKEEKMNPINLVNEVTTDKALDLVGIDGIDLVNMEPEGNLNLVEISNERILDQIDSGNHKNHNPIKTKNQMESDSGKPTNIKIDIPDIPDIDIPDIPLMTHKIVPTKEPESYSSENKKNLEPVKDNVNEKFSQVDVKIEDKLVLKEEGPVEPIKIHSEIIIHRNDIESIEDGNEMSIIKDNPEAKENEINAELDPANKNQQQVVNIINEDKIELLKGQSGHELNFIANKNIINLEENQERHLSNDIKTEDRQNSRPVVSQHMVKIEPNLSSVIPTIEIVSSTEKADKWESTSISPVTVPTKTSKQDVQQLQRNANINLVTATEIPSIIDEMLGYSRSDKKNDDEYESNGILSRFNIRNNNKIDQTTTETPVRKESHGQLGSRLGGNSNKILMDGHAGTTAQPEVTDRVVQKQINRHHVSNHIEGATKSTTKRAAKPTDATKINSHDEKMKQKKVVPVDKKNDGLLSWFSFSKPSNNEPDMPEEEFSIEPDIRVVQKQVNEHHVSNHTEVRAAKPTDATKINSHNEKTKQNKEVPMDRKNDGLLSWFSFSKPSNNEPDNPEKEFSIEPDKSHDIQNNRHTPIHTTKFQASTTQIPTVSDNNYDPTIRYQVRVTEMTPETAKVYQKYHSNSHEESVEPTKSSDVEVTKESIIEEHDYSYDNFEPLKISEIKSYNSVTDKDLIHFKAGIHHVDKSIENKNQRNEYPDGIKIRPVDPMDESEEISSTQKNIQHRLIQINPTSAVINYKLAPQDQNKNKEDNIQFSPSSVVVNHEREHMNHNSDNKNDDFVSSDPRVTTIKPQFVYNNQRDNQQNYQHFDLLLTTIKPNFMIDDQKHDQQDPLQINQKTAIINQENVQQNEEEQNVISFVPGMQENFEQPISHQHENNQNDPTFIIHPNIQQINNDKEHNEIDPNLADHPKEYPKYIISTTTLPLIPNGNKKHNSGRDSNLVNDAFKKINPKLNSEQKDRLDLEMIAIKNDEFGSRHNLNHAVIDFDDAGLDVLSPGRIDVLSPSKTWMGNNNSSEEKVRNNYHHINIKDANSESLFNPNQPKLFKELQKKSEDDLVSVTARPSLAPISPVTNQPGIIYSEKESVLQQPVEENLHHSVPTFEVDGKEKLQQEDQHDDDYDSLDLLHHKPVPIDEPYSQEREYFPTLSTMSTLPTMPTLTTLKDNLKENMDQKVKSTDKIDLEEKIILKAYIDGQKNREHDLSRQNLTDSLPETKISVNEIIKNTSKKLSQSLNHEKPNSVNILKEGLNTNFTNSDKEKIEILQATSNVNKIDADFGKPTTVKIDIPDIPDIDIPDIPLMTHKRVPTNNPVSEYSSTSSRPMTTTQQVNRNKMSTKPSVTTTTTWKVPTTNIINTRRTDLPTTKLSTLPTTTKNEVTTTSKPDKKDFKSSNTTSFLPSKQKPSDPFLFSIEDTNDEKQYNSNVNDQKQHYDNKNVQYKNLAKNNSPHFKGDNELEEEDASVKVSWFSTTPDNMESENEKDTPEITTEVYTEIDVIVGDLLYGDKDISFDQTKLLSSHVKIDQVEILHFVEETEREIASDIDHLKHDLDNLLDLDESMKDFPEIVQEIAKERVEDFFKSMSASMKKVKLGSILQGPKAMSHTTEDSKPSEETNAASNLLNVTADISEKLSKTLEIGTEIDIDLPDMAMTVRKKSLRTNSSSRWESKAVEVNLPDQESIAGEDSTITVSFTAYDNLGSMMALNENFSSSVLSINVIGVEGAEKSIKLTKPLEFKLAHNSLTREEERSCVYWDFARSTWSDEGCTPIVSTSSANSTTCECHHLTNFAILIDMHGVASHEDHKPFLDILTNIGCLISMTGLILCILIYSTFRSAKNERSTINVNLCMCLLLSELIFMFGIGQTHSPGLCAVISAVLHYIFLASFFWMLIAGFQIYVLLVEVFEVDGSRFVHYYLLGYIAPLIIVLFSLLFDTLLNDVSVYGTEKYCWMNYGLHLGISFLCPLSLVMTANFYFLVVAFHKFHVHSMDMIRLKSRKSSIKTYLNGLFGLLFLLGVSWSVGLISLIFPSIVLSYTFTVLNSLQGFFIFFFNCIGNNKIRNEGSRKVREAMGCLFNINLRRRLSRNSSTISDTKTTDVKEYFMPDNHYCVNYEQGDKRQYKRLPQVARDVTYYY